MEVLNIDCVLHIIDKLETKDIISFCCVNKYMYSFLCMREIWKIMIKKDFIVNKRFIDEEAKNLYINLVVGTKSIIKLLREDYFVYLLSHRLKNIVIDFILNEYYKKIFFIVQGNRFSSVRYLSSANETVSYLYDADEIKEMKLTYLKDLYIKVRDDEIRIIFNDESFNAIIKEFIVGKVYMKTVSGNEYKYVNYDRKNGYKSDRKGKSIIDTNRYY